jgi:hypothetical protein
MESKFDLIWALANSQITNSYRIFCVNQYALDFQNAAPIQHAQGNVYEKRVIIRKTR